MSPPSPQFARAAKSTSGNYKTKQTYSYDNLYQLIKVDGETAYNPYQSAVPEFKADYTQTFTFDSIGLGNMTSKVSKESVTPHKTIGDNLNYSFNYVYDEKYAHRLINAGDRYYKYDSNGNIICEQDGSFEGNGEETTYHKITQEAEDVYSTDYGWGLFKEENGASGGVKGSRYCRTYAWNEKNQLVSSVDANYNTAYVYGQDGQRSNKYTANSETLYFNKMWTHHIDSGNNVYGGQTAKNIYLGETRIVTKLNSGNAPTYQEEYYKQYYYYSDHLGSASLISDYKGDEYQRIEYTPYGETWVEKTQNQGLEYLPYKFTAKEMDEETGLYYYGSRYLDPKYSMWISTDPSLGEYIPAAESDTSKLPGMGGVYNNVNLNLYHYAGNNPVKYIDPNGNCQKPSPQIIVIIFVPKNTQQVEPTMFKQTMFTKENGFSDNYSTTACNATAALNIVSMQYTKETGKALSIEQGMDILKSVPNDIINKENANVEDLCPALNSMMKNLEKNMGKTIFKGKFGYSSGWCGFKKATLTDSYFVDAVKSNTFPEHYVNDMGQMARTELFMIPLMEKLKRKHHQIYINKTVQIIMWRKKMIKTKTVKLLSTVIIILLLSGCRKVNALSPYTMKYIDGEPKYYMLDSVRFNVPSNIDFLNWCIPENDTVVNWEKIRVYAYGRQQENIQYMNSDGFDPDFLSIMAKNNYVINQIDISESIKSKKGLLLSHFFTDKRNEIPFTYSNLKKNDLVIGESLFYTSYNEAIFTSPYIEYKLNFVTDEYLIQLGVVFSNSKSTEICTQLPQFFTKQNSEFTWKTKYSREEFMTYILTADRNKLPAAIKDFLDIVESINKTLVIKE